jgi:hypothetical protein
MEKQETLMRSLILTTAIAALATAVLSLSAQAQSVRHSGRHLSQFNDTHGDAGSVSGSRSYGYGAGPYWQGEPTDNLAIRLLPGHGSGSFHSFAIDARSDQPLAADVRGATL